MSRLLLTICVTIGLPPSSSAADDACALAGSTARALRTSERVHAPMSVRTPTQTIAFPSDVGALPNAAVRARLSGRVPLDVFVHVVTEGPRRIAAYDATGRERWTRPFSGEHAAAACGRFVYALEGDTLRALAADTGTERWSMSLEGHVVRLAAVGCDALVARRASRDVGAYAEVVHVLAAETGRTRTELPCAACLPRMITEDTYVWTEPGGVRVLDARGPELTLHVVRSLGDDDDVKGRAGDALLTYDEGELAMIALDGTARFRRRGRVRVLASHEQYVVIATASAVEVLDPASGETRARFVVAGELVGALDDTRGVALDSTRVLLRSGEPLPFEAVLDVAAGNVLAVRALPLSVETTLARGRDVLHGGSEWLLTDAFSESAPIRTQIDREAEQAALVGVLARLSDEDAVDFDPHHTGLGRCALAERPAMRLALLDPSGPPDDGTFERAFARALVSEIQRETSGARLLGAALGRLPADVHESVLVALTAWLSRDDAALDAATFEAWVRAATAFVASARFVDARASLIAHACEAEAAPEACLRADAAFAFAKSAYEHAAPEHAAEPFFTAMEEAIARRADAPLAGVSRVGAILRAAARGRFAFDASVRGVPMTSATTFDFPTVFGVRRAVAEGADGCGVHFRAPRSASRVERGPLRAAYAVRMENGCTGTQTTVLVSAANGGFAFRGEAHTPPVVH